MPIPSTTYHAKNKKYNIPNVLLLFIALLRWRQDGRELFNLPFEDLPSYPSLQVSRLRCGKQSFLESYLPSAKFQ
jgi:hypothetical protein